ncbi:hypothetical protein Salat_2604900, partial [Sesamum alatum]
DFVSNSIIQVVAPAKSDVPKIDNREHVHLADVGLNNKKVDESTNVLMRTTEEEEVTIIKNPTNSQNVILQETNPQDDFNYDDPLIVELLDKNWDRAPKKTHCPN